CNVCSCLAREVLMSAYLLPIVAFSWLLVINDLPATSPWTSGVIVDDEAAEYTGKWLRKASTDVLAGKTNHHDDHKATGIKSARFTPDLHSAGEYEVRLFYTSHANRATKVTVKIVSEDGEATRTVNERESVLVGGVPRALGIFRFAAGKKGSVEVST